MGNPQLLNAFVTLLDTFMSELEKSFPKEADIKITRSSLKLLAVVNPKMIVEEFVSYLSPYKTPLMNKNMEFFMDLNNFELDKETADIGAKIINLLRSTSSDNTDIVFSYIQKLLRVGEKILC